MVKEKILLEKLNENMVNIEIQKTIEIDGVEHTLGEPHRIAFENSELGRKELQDKVKEPYLSAILKIWGDKATVKFKEPENRLSSL